MCYSLLGSLTLLRSNVHDGIQRSKRPARVIDDLPNLSLQSTKRAPSTHLVCKVET